MRTSKTFYTSFQCICAPLLDTEGLVSAGVADATPATARPSRRLLLRTSPSRPAVYALSLQAHSRVNHDTVCIITQALFLGFLVYFILTA